MRKISLIIDGRPIEAEEGRNILYTALDVGIYIPHLCSHPDLVAQGGCKLCVVEIEGRDEPVTSCTTEVVEGMKVTTKSENLNHIRQVAMEFMLAGHPHDCTSCKAYLQCELQALMQYLGVVHARMRDIHRENTRINTNNPLIVREMERCIQCGRCIRACTDLRGVGIIDYQKKNNQVYVGTTDERSLADSDCRFCSACVEVCPTGALVDAEGVFVKDAPREKMLIPCSLACPAHIDIPGYLRFIGEGKYPEAVALIREKVPFPLALGYVCNHKCQDACKRDKLNEAIAIRNLKRFAVENDNERIWEKNAVFKEKTAKKVAVIGGGPAGLTAAYYLVKCGHKVTVYERLPLAGGMMVTGIPEYRLPRTDLAGEVAIIKAAGVNIVTGHNISSAIELKDRGFDSVLVAIGASQGKLPGLPGNDAGNCFTAIDVLRAVSLKRQVELGVHVTILGGGNVAFDCARVFRRLGIPNVNVVCLEARRFMLADREEIEQAEEEGVTVYPGKCSIGVNTENHKITGLKCLDVKKFFFEDDGKLHMELVEGSECMIPTDTLIFATGQQTDLDESFGIELDQFGHPVVDTESLVTSKEGIFAAGDVVTGTKSVIEAIVAGRRAASSIDRYLGGDGDITEQLVIRKRANPRIGRMEKFADQHREGPAIRDVMIRIINFGVVDLGFDAKQAIRETGRCLQCDLRTQITQVKLWTEYTRKSEGPL